MGIYYTKTIQSDGGGTGGYAPADPVIAVLLACGARKKKKAAWRQHHLEGVMGKPVGIRVAFSPLSKYSKGIRLHAMFPLLRTEVLGLT